MRVLICIPLLLALAAPAARSEQDRGSVVRKIATVTHPALSEMSGLSASSYPGIFWVHNDSGDAARIFAIRADAQVIVPGIIRHLFPEASTDDWPGYTIDNAWQYDWEAMAMSDGVLYLADVGNNDNARRDLGVYVVNEPNPEYVTKTRALKFVPVRYPDQGDFPAAQWHFDCEAVFAATGKLYFLTKHRQPGQAMSWEPGTKLYRLDRMRTDRENVLKLIDQHDRLTLPTGADVSADGSQLAVLTYTHLWVFDRPRRGDRWLQGEARVLELDREQVKQNEAIAWEDERTLLMTNEQREIFRIPLDALEPLKTP